MRRIWVTFLLIIILMMAGGVSAEEEGRYLSIDFWEIWYSGEVSFGLVGTGEISLEYGNAPEGAVLEIWSQGVRIGSNNGGVGGFITYTVPVGVPYELRVVKPSIGVGSMSVRFADYPLPVDGSPYRLSKQMRLGLHRRETMANLLTVDLGVVSGLAHVWVNVPPSSWEGPGTYPCAGSSLQGIALDAMGQDPLVGVLRFVYDTDLVTPTLTITPFLSPTPIPSPTVIPTQTATFTLPPTATPSATLTVIPTKTAPPTLPPTATPQESRIYLPLLLR